MIWTRACYPILYGCMEIVVIYFDFELKNAVLHKTIIQRYVEVIDNTPNTTSSSCRLYKKNNVVNLINIYKCKVFHVCPVYLDKLPFSILNQAFSFSCHIISLMA